MSVVTEYLEELLGPDPFADVYAACEPHREAHGPDCGVYPAATAKMQTIATLIQATNAKRILEVGGGIGYSALWLAHGAGQDARVETIDRDAEHVAIIDHYAEQHSMSDCLTAIHSEGETVLDSLIGPYDLIHDDGWFAERPAYYDRMIELLRPGGLLVLANCFLLEEAITGKPRADWSQFADPNWSDGMHAYARHLAADDRLQASFIFAPAWIGLGVKRHA